MRMRKVENCGNRRLPWRPLSASVATSLARFYLRHVPIRKGKAAVWDIVRHYTKRYCKAIPPRRTIAHDGRVFDVEFTESRERLLFFWGRWTPPIEAVLRRRLTPGAVCIDVGANIGYFTTLASRLVGPTGRVIAFEPLPSSFRRCLVHVQLNHCSNVEVHQLALSDREGVTTLYEPQLGRGRDLCTVRPVATQGTASGTIEHQVRTVRLDEFLDSVTASRVNFIKLDVEGAELLALHGMERLLGSCPDLEVLCEVTDSFLKELGGSERELLRYLSEVGYSAYRVAPPRPIKGLDQYVSTAALHRAALEIIGLCGVGEREFQYDALFTRTAPKVGELDIIEGA